MFEMMLVCFYQPAFRSIPIRGLVTIVRTKVATPKPFVFTAGHNIPSKWGRVEVVPVHKLDVDPPLFRLVWWEFDAQNLQHQFPR